MACLLLGVIQCQLVLFFLFIYSFFFFFFFFYISVLQANSFKKIFLYFFASARQMLVDKFCFTCVVCKWSFFIDVSYIFICQIDICNLVASFNIHSFHTTGSIREFGGSLHSFCFYVFTKHSLPHEQGVT